MTVKGQNTINENAVIEDCLKHPFLTAAYTD